MSSYRSSALAEGAGLVAVDPLGDVNQVDFIFEVLALRTRRRGAGLGRPLSRG